MREMCTHAHTHKQIEKGRAIIHWPSVFRKNGVTFSLRLTSSSPNFFRCSLNCSSISLENIWKLASIPCTSQTHLTPSHPHQTHTSHIRLTLGSCKESYIHVYTRLIDVLYLHLLLRLFLQCALYGSLQGLLGPEVLLRLLVRPLVSSQYPLLQLLQLVRGRLRLCVCVCVFVCVCVCVCARARKYKTITQASTAQK